MTSPGCYLWKLQDGSRARLQSISTKCSSQYTGAGLCYVVLLRRLKWTFSFCRHDNKVVFYQPSGASSSDICIEIIHVADLFDQTSTYYPLAIIPIVPIPRVTAVRRVSRTIRVLPCPNQCLSLQKKSRQATPEKGKEVA
jgi:hypothetical protein